MKALIVYDSVHGNTQKVAQAIGDVIEGEVSVCRVGEATAADFKSLDLLVIGSPTHGGRPTPAIQGFVNDLPGPVSNVKVAVFDTRMPAGWVKIFGFAANRITKALKGKGWSMDTRPEGFYVKGREGPLKDGELQRAALWARALAERSR
ncbi:MAG: flavodoxin family protein [Chloroflexota bacterium]